MISLKDHYRGQQLLAPPGHAGGVRDRLRLHPGRRGGPRQELPRGIIQGQVGGGGGVLQWWG